MSKLLERARHPGNLSLTQTFPWKSCLTDIETRKKEEYCERISQVEHGSFTPFVYFSNGSIDSTEVALKKLASKIAEKTKQRYSDVIRLLRCRLSCSLLRSALRMSGSRSRRGGPNWRKPVDIVLQQVKVE